MFFFAEREQILIFEEYYWLPSLVIDCSQKNGTPVITTLTEFGDFKCGLE